MNIRKQKLPRRHLRRSVTRALAVTCRQAETDAFNFHAYVLDLSEAGARLLMSAAMKLEHDIVLNLDAPVYESPLTRHARIVWSLGINDRDRVVGIQFHDCLSDDEVTRMTIAPVKMKY